jgi:hypothetical protein
MEANMDDQARGVPGRVEPAEGAVRAPYNRPTLKVYGTIKSLTQAVGRTGMVADGGKGSMSKTS